MKEEIYQFKISLLRTQPEIWRRFQVHHDITFLQFHNFIQEVMGWKDIHYYAFGFEKFHILKPEMDAYFFGDHSPYANEVPLHELVKRVRQKFFYIYDFKNDWQHRVLFEKRIAITNDLAFPLCIDGKGACPPEDCGGIKTYYDLLHKPEDDWDFSIEAVNKRLRNMRW